MFRALVLLPPDSGSAEPFRALDSSHRTLGAATRALAAALGRRSRMRAGFVLACGIVDPDGRTFSLYGARACLAGKAAPRFAMDPAPADLLRAAAGFVATGASGYCPAPRPPECLA
jgi:hypothetical protein